MRRAAVAATALMALIVTSAAGAWAATTTGFAEWGVISGTSNAFSTTMQLPAVGFPGATVVSDSRSDVATPTGATNWFGENTPPGLQFGSSRDSAYLNLRPRADNATSPSTTTYTFDRATPQGWTFVLGDIDADQVAVSATGADGTAATIAELGFRGAFNLCATTPRPSSVCATNERPKDVPTWDPATATLRGNAGAIDSDGATGWFVPTTALRTLTFTFTRRGGLPVFQTWFAVTKQDVTGTVATTGACDLAAATVSLIDRDGGVVATRAVGTGGGYAFEGVAASDGYRVGLSGMPATCLVVGPSVQPIDLRTGDAQADFTVREIIPVPISGRVTDGTGALEGVTVTLTPQGGGAPRTATTDVEGRYVFDDNPDGTNYTIAVTPPDGYFPEPALQATIPDGATAPVSGQDFALQAFASVSGTISGPDGPVAGVTVELSGPGGTWRAVSGADGTYVVPRVPAGAYSRVVPTPPAGFEPVVVVPVAVGTTDVTGQDITLTRVAATGSVGGTVTLDGAPAAGAVVTIRPAGGGSQTVTTGGDGTYGLGGLTPDTYEIAVETPAGGVALAPRTVTITPAGETLAGQDFAFVAAVTPAPTPSPSPTPDPTPQPDPVAPGSPDDEDENGDGDGAGASPDAGGMLPDAGGSSVIVPVTGLALVLAGATAVAATRRRRS